MPDSVNEEATEMTAMTDPEVNLPEVVIATTGNLVTSGTSTRDHRKDFFKRYLRSPLGKCLIAIAVITTLTVFGYLFAKIVIGALYFDKCSVDRFIPIYLIISSSLLILCIIVLIVVFLKCQREDTEDESVSSHHLIALVYGFLHIVLQLAGSVCVIRTHNDLLDITETDLLDPSALCDDNLLRFAFGVVIFELVLSGLFLIAVILILAEVIYLVCCSPSPEKPSTNR